MDSLVVYLKRNKFIIEWAQNSQKKGKVNHHFWENLENTQTHTGRERVSGNHISSAIDQTDVADKYKHPSKLINLFSMVGFFCKTSNLRPQGLKTDPLDES